MSAADVANYLERIGGEHRQILDAVLDVVRDNIAPGFEEGIQYGMVGFYVPHSVYPDGYHAKPSEPLPFAGFGAQKHHVGLYLFCVYTDSSVMQWFTDAWRATGMRLDMGKACVRVRKLEQLPLDVVAKLFQRVTLDGFISAYEKARPAGRKRRKSTSGTTATRS